MSTRYTYTSAISGLRHLSLAQRLCQIMEAAGLDDADRQLLSGNALSDAISDGMIENVIGRFELPLGVATNFKVNGKDVLVPMAVEEPSVVAAASFMAKLARPHGGFRARTSDPVMRAQIQLLDIADLATATAAIETEREAIIASANACDATLVSHGGGCRDIEIHTFDESRVGPMLVVHLLVDVRDAMGANAVNTMAESLAPKLEAITGGRALLRILSNLADHRTVKAQVELPFDALDTEHFIGERVARGISEACALAEIDPYRAATHNKGIMNGIDPVIVATGNDWRAIEAGAHAFAARNGRYTSLTRWSVTEGQTLSGEIELPMAVGIVGGATKTHPAAKAALRLMRIENAADLACVIASVGLAQNMAALRALSTEGIQRGHMALHARNLAIAAGATGARIEQIATAMREAGEITADKARALMAALDN